MSTAKPDQTTAAPKPAVAESAAPEAGWIDEHRLRELLSPFVAWLATQDLSERERRRHRAAAERFLRWSHGDSGPVRGRQRRYEQYLRHHDPALCETAMIGLAWWTDYRRIVARTLPVD